MSDQLHAAAAKPGTEGYMCQDGIVSAIDPDDPMKGEVTIQSRSACAACHAKGACTSLDSEEKVLSVLFQDSGIAVGDRVRIMMKDSLGLQALLLAMVIPLFLLMSSVLVFYFFLHFSESNSALLGIACLVPYYLTLRLFRRRFSRKFIIHACKF